MGYFAIVRTRENANQDFEVPSCHLNFWSVRALLSRLYFWDVGLQLKGNGDEPLTEFKLALPFRTPKDGMEDLSSHLKRFDVARLLFGTEIQLSESSIVAKIDGVAQTFNPVSVSLSDSCLVESLQEENGSVWKVHLTQPVKKGETAYVRLRFHVLRSGKTFSRASLRNGHVLDLRVSDPRETVGLKKWDFERQIVGIRSLFLFAILPASAVMRGVSPSLHYTRVYEGTVWNEYLGRSAKRDLPEKMIIYQWRHESAGDGLKPYRAYLAASEEPRGFTVPLLILLLLMAFLAAFCGSFALHEAENIKLLAKDFWNFTFDLVTSKLGLILATLSVTGVWARFKGLLQVPATAMIAWRKVITIHHKLQLWLFKN